MAIEVGLGVFGGNVLGLALFFLLAWWGGVWRDMLSIRAVARNAQSLEELRKQHTEELEALRNSFTEYQAFVDRSMALLSSSFPASHERVLSAVDLLWQEVLRVRELNRGAFFVYTLFSEADIGRADYFDKISASVTLTDVEYTNALSTSTVEEVRPYIGEKLWLLFFVYRGFSGWLMVKLLEGKKKRKFYYWNKDRDGKPDDYSSVLALVLSGDELAILMKLPYFQVVDAIQKNLQQKILVAMNELVFGRSLIEIGINEQLKITVASRKLTYPDLDTLMQSDM